MIRIHVVSRFSICMLLLLIILLMPFERKVDAHAYSASYTTLNLTKSSIEIIYMLDELSVIELIGGDVNKNNILEQEEFIADKDQLLEMLKNMIILKIDNSTQDWTQLDSLVLNRKEEAKVILKASYPMVSASQTISLTDNLYSNGTATNYVNLLTVNYGKQTITSALSGKYRIWAMQMNEHDYASLQQTDNKGQAKDLQNEDSGSSEIKSGWHSFFILGINHIITGYDHLLFLFSLLIARQKFKQYAAMITAFTIAHSITLSLTVLGIINVPPAIVEPAIALSICFVAIDNIVRKKVSHRWVLTFLFGLIHGMGFADILIEMNLPRSELAMDLIGFNLGIETVQVTLVAILLPLLVLLHRWEYSRRAVIGGSTLAFVLGAMWLTQRLFFI